MDTLKLSTSQEDIEIAAKIILKGGIVAFPTETVYGLGANCFDEKAVKKIFKAKGRPQDNPMIVHIANMEQLWLVAQDIPNKAYELAEKFWPGPFTMVLEKNPAVAKSVTAGLNTVAVRFSRNNVAQKLIELSQPIAAPSANLSGQPSPTKAKHVIKELDGKIDAVINGENVDIGIESTVLDLTRVPFVLLRPGKVTFEELEKFLGKGNVVKHIEEKGKKVSPKSPGMKYTHYSPKAKVILFEKEPILKFLENYKGEELIVIGKKRYEYEFIRKTFMYDSKEEIAKNIFDWFRTVDRLGVNIVLVEGVDEVGLGLAIMNRLRKAANVIM
jgi:L-threonylcarbamoyladenylate synthase